MRTWSVRRDARLLGVVGLLFYAAVPALAVKPTDAEKTLARRMAARWFSREAQEPPFSFVYNGRPSAVFLKDWKRQARSRKLDAVRTEHVLTYTDPDTGLSVQCRAIAYRDFPTVEWVLRFTNTGNADTPIIENIRVLDVRLERGARDAEFVLRRNLGSMTTPQDYQPRSETMAPGADKQVGSSGGRPLNSDMPYFHVSHGKQAMLFALGWPGDWTARFTRDAANGMTVSAGQRVAHLRLGRWEQVRTPLVAVQFALGDDPVRAQNLWRRWMIAHNLPRPGGKPMPPVFSGAAPDLYPNQVFGQDDEIPVVEGYRKRGLRIDYWWRDAGWYPCRGAWWNTGTWEPDPKLYPDGLRIVADRAHADGMRFTVWFEVERAVPGTWLFDNRPEWLLDAGQGQKLLNLGDPEALQWATDLIDRLITEHRIDMYRQDFNMDPAAYWAAHDAEDRQGITEIRYVEGLLALWDELKRRHPDMPFDNCASGGRRNCLEMMRRGLPLSKSDYAGGTTSSQAQLYGIAPWLPYFGAGMGATQDPYVFRSNIAPWSAECWDTRDDKVDWDRLRGFIAEWRQVSPFMMGDFYPLTPYSLAENVWMAWQFDSPEKGEGMIQAFRRAECPEASITVRPRGLAGTRVYELVDLDTGGVRRLRGREMMDKGVTIPLAAKPGAATLLYRKAASRR